MRVTVILCTYNRCQSLAQALESACALTMPDSDTWEVLVVDNNSTDATRELVNGFCRRYPDRFRYLFESRQGKSHALNSAVREARGDVLAFLDDDVVVDPAWLHHLVAPLKGKQWAGVGGRTLPEQGFSPPPWLSLDSSYALGPLAIFDLGLDPAELKEPPFGNNMAFKKGMLEKYGGFRTDFGPPPSKVRGEDTDFGRRVLAAGERLSYQPLAVVYHAIPKTRVRREYFLAWWFTKARADLRESGRAPRSNWSVGGIPLVLFRRLAIWTLRWIIAAPQAKRFSCKVNVWLVSGQIVEYFRQSLDKTTQPQARFPTGPELFD